MSPPLPWLLDSLEQLKSTGLFRSRAVTRLLPEGECEIDGRRLFNFTSNDYLNLASHPQVIAAAVDALPKCGVGARGSALLFGRTEYHAQLESELAEFKSEEAAILFPTGFAANLGMLTALIGSDDVVFCDRLNHASLVDGCKATRARFRVYRHEDLETLERELQKAEESSRRWIVTDGVFSMDGDLAPLPELCRLAEKHMAHVVVDEAHATGVFGREGRGAAEHFGVENRIAVRVGTLSKALGTLGGFVAGSQTLIDFLWNRARTQFFSTALPPAICAAAIAALAIVKDEPQRRKRLLSQSEFFRQQLREHGVQVPCHSLGPIVPILLDDPFRAADVSHRLRNRGFLIGSIRPPSVPEGTSRLRISLTIVHDEQRLSDLAKALAVEME